MLEITSKSCYKCHLETIIGSNGEYFWINLRDFEVEIESKWLNIFNKHGNKSTLKYKREIIPDIKVQTDKIFIRNYLFEQVIKSCKATNKEFLLIKELGICLYEENYYTEEIIQIQENTEKPSIKEINKVSNKVLTKKLTKEADNKSIDVTDKVLINEPHNKSINESDNKSINKQVNSNSTSWYDTKKFNKILATIDNNNFNHKNKIGKLKFNDINNLINSIKGNTISEADTKKKINELNEIKKVETNSKRLIGSQKKLLSLFDDLKTIFNETVNESNSNTKNENESDNKSDYESDNESYNESDNESDDKKDKHYFEIRQLNSWFETIYQTKSLEEQIELLTEKGEFLSEYWYVGYYHDNKELNYKPFKAKAAHLLTDLDNQLFEKIFGYTFVALVDKLINTVDKEENQTIVDNIENNKDITFGEYKFDKAVIKQSGDLIDAAKIILEINE